MNDLRNLAKVIVERCCAVKPGERVLVEATGCEDALAAEVLRAVYDAGGAPFYNQMWDSLQSAWLEHACEESVRLQAAWDAERMRSMDVYIGLRSSANKRQRLRPFGHTLRAEPPVPPRIRDSRAFSDTRPENALACDAGPQRVDGPDGGNAHSRI